jgi:hypothetical protein
MHNQLIIKEDKFIFLFFNYMYEKIINSCSNTHANIILCVYILIHTKKK